MPEEPALGRRARRAIPLIAAALAVIIVTGLVYLRPNLHLNAAVFLPRPSPTQPLLGPLYQAAYDFVTPSIGWALIDLTRGSNSPFWVFHTSDGARHWTQQFSDSTVLEHSVLQFFDATNGYFSLGQNASFRTSDAGRHWTRMLLPPNTLGKVQFVDPRHGWYVGSTDNPGNGQSSEFASTADGGLIWEDLPLPPAPAQTVFRSEFEGWSPLTDPNGLASVYSTHDGGVSWQPHRLPPDSVGKPFNVLEEVVLLPRIGVLAVTADLSFTSFDGGDTWREVAPLPAGNFVQDIAFQDSSHWWTMRAGNLFKTSDAGQSWQHVALQLDEWDYFLRVIDARHAWARLEAPLPRTRSPLGSGLAFTSDGGVHWIYANVPHPPGVS